MIINNYNDICSASDKGILKKLSLNSSESAKRFAWLPLVDFELNLASATFSWLFSFEERLFFRSPLDFYEAWVSHNETKETKLKSNSQEWFWVAAVCRKWTCWIQKMDMNICM